MYKRVFKQKGSRVYRLRYKLSNGPQIFDVPLRTPNKEIAERKARQLIEDQEKELLGDLSPRKKREAAEQPTTALLAEFIASLKERKRSADHVRHNQHRLKALFAACHWHVLRDVTAESFKEWQERSVQLSAKTRNEYLGHAVAFLNWLIRNERSEHNPLRNVRKLPTAGEETFKRRALTLEEFVRLMQGSGKRRLVYFLACCTGLRRGELKQLRWADIDLSETEPVIRLRPETTKNKKGGTIPLLPALADLLRQQKKHHFSGLVFPHGVPESKTLAKDLKACGIAIEDERGHRVDFHALRHTFVSLLAHVKVSELVRMKLARHSAWKQTDGYTDPKSVPLADGIAMLAAALPSSLASPNFGKTRQNMGKVVQTGSFQISGEVSQVVAADTTLPTSFPTLENLDWRRGGDSNPR
jgi:integrase